MTRNARPTPAAPAPRHLGLLVVCAIVAPSSGVPSATSQKVDEAGIFVDATEVAGLDFRHVNGAFGMKWLPEVNGAGASFFDVDGDRWLDLLLVQGRRWEGHDPAGEATATPTMKLYRNRGDGTFDDITAGSGLDVELYGFAAVPADFDNDGDQDVYVTAYGPNRMFRNEGKGRFVDVTAQMGGGDPAWSSSAAWLDFDRDGDLDLFVGNYLDWRPGTHQFCSIDGETRAYCNPRAYPGSPPTLYRNDDTHFTELRAEVGLPTEGGKTLGVVAVDVDSDTWVDLVMANDTEPDWLLRNRGNGTFEDIGMRSGMAVDESGLARAGMGIDTAHMVGEQRVSIAVGNFSNEMIGLYDPVPNGIFADVAARGVVGRTSLAALTFGLFFFDYNLDGRSDLLAVNGHIYEHPDVIEPGARTAQLPLLYRNDGEAGFREVAAEIGGPLSALVVGRGAAYADYDRDGDLDVVITTNAGSAYVWRNRMRDRGAPPHVLRVAVQGTAPRDAIGTRVAVTAGPLRQVRQIKSGGSYLSQSERLLTFAIPAGAAIETIEVDWISGARLVLDGASVADLIDTEITLVEGLGLTRVEDLPVRSSQP